MLGALRGSVQWDREEFTMSLRETPQWSEPPATNSTPTAPQVNRIGATLLRYVTSIFWWQLNSKTETSLCCRLAKATSANQDEIILLHHRKINIPCTINMTSKLLEQFELRTTFQRNFNASVWHIAALHVCIFYSTIVNQSAPIVNRSASS